MLPFEWSWKIDKKDFVLDIKVRRLLFWVEDSNTFSARLDSPRETVHTSSWNV